MERPINCFTFASKFFSLSTSASTRPPKNREGRSLKVSCQVTWPNMARHLSSIQSPLAAFNTFQIQQFTALYFGIAFSLLIQGRPFVKEIQDAILIQLEFPSIFLTDFGGSRITVLASSASSYEHISPIIRSLHWLPAVDRIAYKLSTLTYSSVSGTGPQFLSKHTPNLQPTPPPPPVL